MRILFLTHRVPFPPNRGDRIRSYHLLKHLSSWADVDLACLADEPVTESTLRELSLLCRRVAAVPLSRAGRWARAILSLARGRSMSEGLFESKSLRRTLEAWQADIRYDAVLVYCSSMWQFYATVRPSQSTCVVDFIDVDSAKWFDYAGRAGRPLRWLYQLEGRRVRKLEKEIADLADAVAVVSESEADLLRAFCPEANVRAIPNGVDMDYFHGPAIQTADTTQAWLPSALEFLFVGALDYYPNVDGVEWFSRKVWPEIKAFSPESTFTIVGRRPTGQVCRLDHLPGIHVVGEVADVTPYLNRASVVVVPLRIARGIQNKVLEAMAAGKPVIASPQAIEGLNVVPGVHLLEASAEQEWITHLKSMLESKRERAKLAVAGYEFVRAQHDWDHCLKPMSGVLGQAQQTVGAQRHPVLN